MIQMKYINEKRKYEIYKKYFEMGFEQAIYNTMYPNRWLGIDKSFAITFKKANVLEMFPWNEHWAYQGYKDGYDIGNSHPFAWMDREKSPNVKIIWRKYYKKFFKGSEENVQHNKKSN